MKSLTNNLSPHSFYRVLTVLVVGIAHTSMEYLFECPSVDHRHFTLYIVYLPALAIYLAAWLTHSDLRDAFRGVLHGCFNARMRPLAMARFNCKHFCYIIVYTLVNASLGPLTWVILCFIRGNVPTCNDLGAEKSNQTLAEELERAIVKHGYQTLGVDVLLCVVVLFGVSMLVRQCMVKTTVYQGLFVDYGQF